jgi:hypothetical protein
MGQNLFRFTLSHSSGSKVISEPEGWNKIKLTLERDKEYHSLVELIETPFLFYGSNGVFDGGKDYLKNINNVYGIDAQVNILIEISNNDGFSYEDLFVGLIDMQSLKDIDSRKIEVVITRDDLWSKFKNRVDTPVIINDNANLDGGASATGDIVYLNLTSQKIQQKHVSHLSKDAGFPGLAGIEIGDPGVDTDTNDYVQFDWNVEELNEIDEKFSLSVSSNPYVPVNLFTMEYKGSYEFDIRIDLAENSAGSGNQNITDYVEVYIQVNITTPILFTTAPLINTGFHIVAASYLYNDTLDLEAGDKITIYAKRLSNRSFTVLYQQSFTLFLITVDAMNYCNITANTVYIETQAESFFVHDVANKILDRVLNLSTPFYSEYLGSPATIGSYAEYGCGWPFILVRGLQVRQYSLSEKPFSISFKQWWEGLNPIHNLGLTYDIVGGNPVIRVEEKAFFYDVSPIITLDWVDNIEESYDKDYIFNKIKVGYKKWQSEDISGIDDPQTKHTYATLFKFVGQELILESDFIAASLAIETTRRTTKIKSVDYKFDNDTFIIAIDPVEESSPPGTWNPSTDDYFDSVTNLLNADTRYNIALTPARNLLRWLNLISGCLQKDLTSSVKFTGGEGNYDMESNWNSFVYGNCFNITDSNLSEKQDLALATYYPLTGHLFQPILLEFKHPLSYDNYKLIRDNRTMAIAVSGTDSSHHICFIKKLEYDLINSLGTFTVWKK